MESVTANRAVNPEWFTGMILGGVPNMTEEVDMDNNPVEKLEHFRENDEASRDYLQNWDVEQNSERRRSSHYKDTSMLKVPFIGRVHYVYDIQGFMQIGFIFFYWIYGSFTSLFVVLLPMYNDGKVPLPLLLLYCFVSICCIVSLIRANTMNPGRVTESITLQYTEAEREFCKACSIQRPVGAHHCRRCKHCVTKMDHHCPWINNCVGDENQYMFVLLLFYAVALSASTFAVTMLHFYYFPECQSCNKESFFIYHKDGLMRGAVVLAVLMIAFAGALLTMQYVNLVFEMTSLDWMRLQSELKDHFDISKLPKPKRSGLKGLEAAFGKGNKLLWFLPCRKRGPKPKSPDHEIV